MQAYLIDCSSDMVAGNLSQPKMATLKIRWRSDLKCPNSWAYSTGPVLCAFYVVVCVLVVGSVHNDLEPKWWLIGRWGVTCGSGMGRELK